MMRKGRVEIVEGKKDRRLKEDDRKGRGEKMVGQE